MQHKHTTFVASDGHKAQITVFLDTMQTDSEVQQYFRIEALNVRHLRYFTDDKFLGYHKLQDELAKYYIGDGENIIYYKKQSYRNVIVVLYKKNVENFVIPEEYKDKQFILEADIPSTFGCLNCIYWRKNNRVCTYYKKMGMDIKQNCVDFRQKEKKVPRKKKPAVPVAENQVDRTTQIKLDRIADSLGITITELMEQNGNDIDQIIDKYNRGELRLLNE